MQTHENTTEAQQQQPADAFAVPLQSWVHLRQLADALITGQKHAIILREKIQALRAHGHDDTPDMQAAEKRLENFRQRQVKHLTELDAAWQRVREPLSKIINQGGTAA